MRLFTATSSTSPTSRDQLRGERTMVRVRWVAAAWALAQVQLYEAMPYPPGVRQLALTLVAVLAVGNLGMWVVTRTVTGSRAVRLTAAAGLAFEVAIASAFVWLYAFDHSSALWVVLFLVPVAGAARFALPGAITAWVAVSGLYVGRELWSAARYGFELSVVSVTFRCGMLALVALVVGLLTRDLVAERERARSLERWRARLVAMLAHDIRSPLAAIDMALAGVERTGTEEDRAALLGVARRQTSRVLALAHDLLDLAASDQGALVLRRSPTELSGIVHRALRYTDPAGAVTVEVPDGIHVDVDADRIEQVIVNLAVNATTHGRPPVVISARAVDGQALVEVRDHGEGVPAEEQLRLFEAFGHPSGAGRDRTSVGLGLWVAGLLVDAHGGTIAYRAAPDGGAVFAVTLPLATSPPPDTTTRAHPEIRPTPTSR